ncbi:MAG TPA: DNA-3-methyladenine glycosylase 2 family protein, partial [Clostridiales bacterium UBA9856]|nr:DNA-3-methyladenine glycosylase 2 family protein [Clostridiales bacterium UBA9856]
KIYNRLEALCNGNVAPNTISKLTDEQIRSTGTSNAKVGYIRNITNAIITGTLDFENLRQLSDKEVISSLTKIRGIGNWTAKMYLMFVLNRQDILPYEDGAFLQSYRWLYKTEDCSPSSIKAKCKKWTPYSSVAARYLYRALDLGLTKTQFHLYGGKR